MKHETARAANGQFASNSNGHTGLKLCTGPAHDEPTLLPANEKYFHRIKTGPRAGKLIARCRLCTNWHRLKNPGSNHGWVPITDAWPIINEAVNRIGLHELSKRTNLSKDGLRQIIMKQNRYVQKRTLRLITLELISAKRKGEQPHPHAKALHMRRLHRHQGTCAGCGTTLSNYTEGCPQCWDRQYKRTGRGTGE
jgi:hypothetical protein